MSTALLHTTRPLTAAEARALTDRIRSAAESLAGLLHEAYERRAWEALGYASWREYATTELSISQSRAYQLLDQAKVIAAIQDAAGGISNVLEISERDARHLAPILPEVTEAISTRVENGEDPAVAIAAVVEEKREERIAQRREEEGREDEDEDHQPDLVEELERAHAEVQVLRAALEAEDKGAELLRERERYARLEGRLQQELVTSREAQRQAKYQGDVLKKIREALGVGQTQAILPRIRDLMGGAR